MAFKPIDNKRDTFRKYLESSGVIEVLSKSITKLMESQEKPESPVEFIRENMGLSLKEQNKIDFLKDEVEAYKKQVDDLKKEIESLKLERKSLKNSLTIETTKGDVCDATVKIENEKLNNEEDKKTEEIQQQAPVSENGTTEVEEISKVEVPSTETNEDKAADKVVVSLVGEAVSEPADK